MMEHNPGIWSVLIGMSFWEMALWSTGIILIPYLAARLLRKWKRHRAIRRRLAEIEALGQRDLKQERVRHAVQHFIESNGIVGSADVRHGFVLPANRPDDSKRHALNLMNAYAMMRQTPGASPEGELYYAVKSPGEGTGWSYYCSMISIPDIGSIARMLESVDG